MKEHIIHRIIAKILIPFIQLYALYVIMHGDSGPGGGFQGGAIFGASIILYVLSFGLKKGQQRISEKTRDILTSAGVLLYAGVGLVCMIIGGNYLEYNILPIGTPQFASHIGILIIEIGIGITVAAVMITIFFETARQSDD